MALSAAARTVWAKAGYDPDRQRWLPLWLHLFDSGAVAEHLARKWLAPAIGDLLEREFANSTSGIDPVDEFCLLASWLASVHDIGKCTPAFACQVPSLDDRMREHGLIHETLDSKERRKAPHALAGQHIVEQWLKKEHKWPRYPARALASIAGAHHGIPPTKSAVNNAHDMEHLIGEGLWHDVRVQLLSLVTERTNAAHLLPHWANIHWSQPFLVELSGLIIVADWIASCEDYFPHVLENDDAREFFTPQDHAKRVQAGIARLEFPEPWRPKDEGISADDLLRSRFTLPTDAKATDIQTEAVHAARTMSLPGLLIIEDSTGGGKTEAAKLAAEILAARTGKSGTLFALPTQATTDAMFTRDLDWLERIEQSYQSGGAPSIFSVALQHGRARLNEQTQALRRTGWEIHDRLLGALGGTDEDKVPHPTKVGQDEYSTHFRGSREGDKSPQRIDTAILSWFSGRKKSMLSDFVVTTVDHVLFAAMRAPHLATRHLGLSRKVVIIDEVHSYSTYMNAYLDRALTWLASYGVPVILLSATLSEARASALVNAYQRGLTPPDDENRSEPENLSTPFPCIISASQKEVRITPTKSSGRSSQVAIKQLEADSLVPLLKEKLANGGCALVVRNTVRRAQETYTQLKEHFGEDVSLNHARFTIADRLQKDADLVARFGPPRSKPHRPDRAIVVATQVVEQSLDIDFDLLITDLAPIDLILQRMGRLHRHTRTRPQALASATCYVDMLPSRDQSDPQLDSGAKWIYGDRDLLLTAGILDTIIQGRGVINTPDDIHNLIESVYGQIPSVPPSWEEALTKARKAGEAKDRDKHNSARAFLLDPPQVEQRAASLVDWLHTHASDNEEEGRAHVRDGEDSLEVLLLSRHTVGGQEDFLTLPSEPQLESFIVPSNRIPDRKAIRAMAMSAVRLPATFNAPHVLQKTIDELEKFYVAEWQKNHDLAGQLFLILEDGEAEVNGVRLKYSPHTGLEEIKSQ
ncbi:MAG: CRISPR-associated helicase Cas3' [Actinomycetaceae bacterium]|nr:CRISPR-associated helicase Cas3' [Actinomycetaceae bacterium]